MIRVACPTCFRVFHVEGGCAGRCPGCGQLVKAPDPDEAKEGLPAPGLLPGMRPLFLSQFLFALVMLLACLALYVFIRLTSGL